MQRRDSDPISDERPIAGRITDSGRPASARTTSHPVEWGRSRIPRDDSKSWRRLLLPILSITNVAAKSGASWVLPGKATFRLDQAAAGL